MFSTTTPPSIESFEPSADSVEIRYSPPLFTLSSPLQMVADFLSLISGGNGFGSLSS